jgi:7-cyano-7-deazaguanine reductase
LFRFPARVNAKIGVGNTLPFFGIDIWNAYEVSWLNLRGKPQVAIATVTVPADSPNIIESKSFKLYLNSFNQTKLAGSDALIQLAASRLSAAAGAPVHVQLTLPDNFGSLTMAELEGTLLDRLDIEVDSYTPAPELLRANQAEAIVEETHLLKSNCLVTGQPDWGSVQIHYVGSAD